jgi:polyisoprenoid-binding protein YceI
MIFRAAFAATLVLVSVPLRATTYTLEPNHTQGIFRWNHLGFSSPAAQFGQGEGTLEFDQADPTRSAVKVTIPLSTLNTGVPDLDEDFRSEDFFQTAKFPTATFTSTQVERGSAPERLKVTGNLNLHGVIKRVTLEVTIIQIGTNPRTSLPTVGFEATTTIKRSDFGLGKYVPQVGDEIEIRIPSQAVEAKAYGLYLQSQAEKAAAAADQAKRQSR